MTPEQEKELLDLTREQLRMQRWTLFAVGIVSACVASFVLFFFWMTVGRELFI